MATQKSCDVAIIGAGVSGLTAARLLLKARPELQVLVLEASDRVGGRTLSKPVKCTDGTARDWCFGGSHLGKAHNRVQNLARELGLTVSEVAPTPGKSVLEIGDTVDRYEGDSPNLGTLTLMDLDRSLKSLDKQAKTLMQNPKGWAALDGMTLAQKISKETWKQTTRHCLTAITEPCFEGGADQISCLQALRIANSAGGLLALMAEGDGVKIAEGAQAICTRIADTLGPDRILLGREVTEISDDGLSEGSVRVTTRGGDGSNCEQIAARYVILTLPLASLFRIKFSPDLPAAKRDIISAAGTLASAPSAVSTVSVVITYKEAFWRRAGCSGDLLSHLGNPVTSGGSSSANFPIAPISIATEATSADGCQPALVLMTGYTTEHRWPTFEARRADVPAHLARFYPPQEVLDFVDYAEHDWGVGLPGGASPLPPGSASGGYCDPAVLASPSGRIHFAGTDFAAEWIGAIEGAVQSASRVAGEVTERLLRCG